MAAGTFVFYQHAVHDMMRGLLDLQSQTFVVDLVSQAYTPNAKSHSVFSADVSAHLVTSSGYAGRTLGNTTVAITSGSYVTWDADDLTISAAATMKAKYAIVSRAGGDRRLVGYFDLETTQVTGVEVTQLVTQWNAVGITQVNNPSA